ncbi:hypothetical protein F0562_011791 [Nyssa sinensis]|uniref:Uncharacterized protein n=1 Tax=Nyssa sinensis TaxID=561372 RepID=A0A5J4ZTB8_9ASTE|nr:hypothetical protein F0562_011791 [Nyssa sinensis]
MGFDPGDAVRMVYTVSLEIHNGGILQRKGGGITNENEKCGGSDKEMSEDNHRDNDDSDGSWFNENIDFSDDDIFVYCDKEDEKWNILQNQTNEGNRAQPQVGTEAEAQLQAHTYAQSQP